MTSVRGYLINASGVSSEESGTDACKGCHELGDIVNFVEETDSLIVPLAIQDM